MTLPVSLEVDVLLVVCDTDVLADDVIDLETTELIDILGEPEDVLEIVLLDVAFDVLDGDDVVDVLEEAESLELPELLELPDEEIDTLELPDGDDDELKEPVLLEDNVELIVCDDVTVTLGGGGVGLAEAVRTTVGDRVMPKLLEELVDAVEDRDMELLLE